MRFVTQRIRLTITSLLFGLFGLFLSQQALAVTTQDGLQDPKEKAAVNPLDEAVAAPTPTLNTTLPPGVVNDDVKTPWISTSKVHEYLGVATLISTVATALTAPNSCHTNCSNQPAPTHGTHQTLGRTTGALALATVATGFMFHWKDMHLFEDGLSDPDTQHWLLAGTGALVMADAITKAPAKNHAAQAEAGAVMMLVAIKLAW
jgi:hypothetical protein